MFSFKNLFLPVGLIITMILATMFPEPGRWMGVQRWPGGWSAQDVIILIIFLASGLQLPLSQLKPGGGIRRVLVCGILVNQVMGPLLGALMAVVVPADIGLRMGILALACVPNTISSGVVIAKNAGGSFAAALGLTVVMTIVGTVTLPLVLPPLMGASAGIDLPMLPLLITIVWVVIVPLAVGMGIRRIRPIPANPVLTYLPSLCVMGTVWLAVSANAEVIRSLTPARVLYYGLLGGFYHVALGAAAWALAVKTKLAGPESLSLIIVASQKTLPLALTAIVACPADLLPAGAKGTAVVFLVSFHLLQILVDSAIAPWIANRLGITAPAQPAGTAPQTTEASTSP